MKVMVMVKATKSSEAGEMPSQELLEAMTAYNEDLVKAGIMLGGEGLHPSSAGFRVRFSGQERSVIDGPFAETKELVAGYWLWQVSSMDEAVEWVKRCPNPMMEDSEIEIRRIFEAEDFGEAYTPELAEREEKMRRELEAYQLPAPRWEVGRERVIAGLQGHFDSETRGNIPKLWQSFEELRPSLPDAVASVSYGVCQTCGEDGFDYLAGVEVQAGTKLPEGLATMVLPAQRYAIFTHEGPAPELFRTFEAIHSQWLPKSGHRPASAPCFERYGEEFDPQTLTGGTEVWIPIAP